MGSLHLRHIHPLRAGLDEICSRYTHILVPEMNDQGAYGFGQLTTMLRAKTCNPAIQSLCKMQGLTFRIREITDAAEAILAAK